MWKSTSDRRTVISTQMYVTPICIVVGRVIHHSFPSASALGFTITTITTVIVGAGIAATDTSGRIEIIDLMAVIIERDFTSAIGKELGAGFSA